MEWLSSSMVFRAAGQETTKVSWVDDNDPCRHRRDSPSSVSVWLEETPSVSVTTTEYRPRSSLSGLVKVILELRAKVQALGGSDEDLLTPPPQTTHVLPFAVTDTRGQSPIGL